MTADDWRRVKQIFGEALERDAAEREAFVDAACGHDATLASEVRSLLHYSDAAAGMYEAPVVRVTRMAAALETASPAQHTLTGTIVGPYRVLHEIGRGGMGSVYLAERIEGEFDQRVAIKFVGNIASGLLLRRFRDERRILATLDHPNIAHLLDGGTSPTGLPYVIMEYVDGVPIDAFCDQHDLDLDARLQLFRLVCSAVQYAHQRLVVHRDLKPSNILVTAEGIPKLLDFGIAKIVEPGEQPDAAATTMFRALTPESASPEQVRGDPITIATDVYALGVLLYRLITGRSPYGSITRTDALFRSICEDVPPAPSGLEGGVSSPELDLIVLKALRKEPERRYGSVEQFSDDIERYRDGRPLLAAPDSRRYRAYKFIMRHRIAVAGATVALTAVLAGASIAMYQARVAQRERARAEQRFADVRRLANSFLFEFHDAIADLPGSLNARQLVVKRAAEYLDGLAREAHDDVALQRELATANTRLGEILGGGGVSSLGDLDQAESRYNAALERRRELALRADADQSDLDGLAQLRVQLSRFFIVKGDLARAEQEAREATQVVRASPGLLATAYHALGFAQARRGENDAALASLRDATRRATTDVERNPSDARAVARHARIETDFGEHLGPLGNHRETLDVLGDAQRRLEGLLAQDPLNTRYRSNLSLVLNFAARSFQAMGDYPRAIEMFTRSNALAGALHDEAPEDTTLAIGAMMIRHALAMAHIHSGDPSTGLPILRQAEADAEAIVKRAPQNGFTLNQLAAIRVELGETMLKANAHSREACATVGAGVLIWRDLDARGQLPGDVVADRATYEALWAKCGSVRP